MYRILVEGLTAMNDKPRDYDNQDKEVNRMRPPTLRPDADEELPLSSFEKPKSKKRVLSGVFWLSPSRV